MFSMEKKSLIYQKLLNCYTVNLNSGIIGTGNNHGDKNHQIS